MEYKQIKEGKYKVLHNDQKYIVQKQLGKWYCNCQSFKFRGRCKHVAGVLPAVKLLPKRVPVPSMIGHRAASVLMKLERFTVSPFPVNQGRRVLITLSQINTIHSLEQDVLFNGRMMLDEIYKGKKMWFRAFMEDIRNCQYPDWYGTVLDVIVTDGGVMVIDVPVWKSEPQKNLPLRERMKHLKQLPDVAFMNPVEVLGEEQRMECEAVLIRDLQERYSDKNKRAWLVSVKPSPFRRKTG